MNYLKLGAVVVLLGIMAATHFLAWRQGGLETRKDVAEAQLAELVAMSKKQLELERRALDAEAQLQKVLSQPKAAPQVRTVVRENHSDCVVPQPVHDRVRESRSEANAAIRASLGAR